MWLFVLSFEYNVFRIGDVRYFIPTIERKNINAMIDGRNFSDNPLKNEMRTFDSISKFMTCQGTSYTGCFLDYTDFKKYY